jgi:hypothetical protein
VPRSLLLLSLLLSACIEEDLDTEAAALESDPVRACPVPEIDAIPGHEAVFYECAEEAADFGMGCGPDGYLIGYGARYARRFYRETRPHMSARGREWIDEVLVCLQRELRERIDETTSCDDIHTIAFDTHPGCYVEAGFCSLPLLDLLHVVWTIDLREWLGADAWRQVLATLAACPTH